MNDGHKDDASVPAPRDKAAQVALMKAGLVDLEASERWTLAASTVISAALVPLLVILLRIVMLDSPWRLMFVMCTVSWMGFLGFAWHRCFQVRSERIRRAEELKLLEQVLSAEGPGD
jgi:hypothetical protein